MHCSYWLKQKTRHYYLQMQQNRIYRQNLTLKATNRLNNHFLPFNTFWYFSGWWVMSLKLTKTQHRRPKQTFTLFKTWMKRPKLGHDNNTRGTNCVFCSFENFFPRNKNKQLKPGLRIETLKNRNRERFQTAAFVFRNRWQLSLRPPIFVPSFFSLQDRQTFEREHGLKVADEAP